jgi:glycosyltransferase involved in cell wall biosynthesis
MKKRITVLFPIAELPIGGTEQQLLELAKGLSKRKFRVIVLHLKKEGGPLESEFKQLPGVRLINLKRKGIFGFLVLFKILAIIHRMKVDVVQPFMTPAIFFSIIPALICRTPVKIVTERSGPGRRKGTPLRYRMYLHAEDFLARFVDWAVTNSKAGRSYLIERGIDPSRVKVIYNGVNLHRLNAANEKVCEIRQKLGVPPSGKVVGMVATLFPVKNHAMFLIAAARIYRVNPDTRFALVGDGPLRTQLESLSHNLGLDSRITFFGDQRDVGAYLAAFDIAVLTSETEGCSNFLLEAMAMGKPVVATDVGGNRELVYYGKSGVLVPPRDAEALSDALAYLLANPTLAQSMGQMGREIVITRFCLENMVSQYESLYEDTLQGKNRFAGLRLHGVRAPGRQNPRLR